LEGYVYHKWSSSNLSLECFSVEPWLNKLISLDVTCRLF